MDKKQAKQKIAELVEEFSGIPEEELAKKSEFQIQTEFIDPLFEALGWNMRKDAERERKILGKRADYILKVGNQEVAIIEAKKTSIRLGDEKEGEQAVSYAYHQKIKFAVLTNFKQIRIYHALNHTTRIDRNLLKDDKGYLWINCENFIKEFDRLCLLSKESFENQEINKLLENVNKRLIKPIDESILQDLLEIRRILSSDLKNKRTYLSSEQIDEAVQILIDRLIFMRSVEDRGLEANDFLLKIKQAAKEGFTEKNLWALLKEQFKRFDKTYNSKLFADGLLEKDDVFFDQKTLIKTIEGLYYGTEDHQARYKFNIIPVDLLGSIYEQYLGVVLRGTEKRVRLDLKSGKRKKMGIYYTPSYIVDYIVKNTIREYCKDKSLDEVLNIKVVDPACGSGSFLIKAFQELINIAEERLKKGEKSKEYKQTFQGLKEKLSLGEKATILKNCIYGVDLDEKAVELAQLNLLLKILEGETRENKRLPNLLNNIRNGNSLISDSKFDKAFNWHAQFPEVFTEGGFDIVVGNPPYGLVFDIKIKKILEETIPTFRRNNDLYVAFIEKGLKLLKSKGFFSYIIPNTFLRGDYFKSLREFILDNSNIEKIIDFGTNQIFKDPNVFNSIIILKKEEKDKFSNKITYYQVPFKEDLSSFNINEISDKREVYQKQFNNNPWILQDTLIEKINNVKDKIIGDICYVKDIGFNYWTIGRGKVRGESIGSRVFYEGSQKDKRDIPYLKGRDITRYNYSFGNHWLKHDYKKFLNKKVDIFRFTPKFLEISPKIIYRQTADRIIATIDTNKYYLDKTVHLVVPKENLKLDLYALLGILNSKLMLYCYKNIVNETGRTFAQVKTIYIKHLPIKIPNEKQSEKIKELVERIMKFHKEGKSEQDIRNVDYEIDEEVYRIYGISEEKIIEGGVG